MVATRFACANSVCTSRKVSAARLLSVISSHTIKMTGSFLITIALAVSRTQRHSPSLRILRSSQVIARPGCSRQSRMFFRAASRSASVKQVLNGTADQFVGAIAELLGTKGVHGHDDAGRVHHEIHGRVVLKETTFHRSSLSRSASSARLRSVRSSTKATPWLTSSSKLATPIKTGTRLPSFRKYSFS